MDREPRVFVVDDDPGVLKALERLLRLNGFPVEGFAAADAFLNRLPFEGPACLILDLRMPGLGGLDVQQTLARRGMSMPIIFLSGQADVPSTAKAMKEGAVDFLVKPVDEPELLSVMRRAKSLAIAMDQERHADSEMRERLARLTKREYEVCELVARGLLNKQIASELGTSEKTVKVHRGRVMRKLEVNSVAELVRLLSKPVSSRHRA